MFHVTVVKYLIVAIVSFGLGLTLGAYLFTDVQPRSFLAVGRCTDCLNPNELVGLVGSIVTQKFPQALPFVVKETDKTVVIKYPYPLARHHYVAIPKKDIKNAGELSSEDIAYLTDAYAVMRAVILEKSLTRYRIYTNGPGYQAVAYLHFHLVAR